MTNDQHQDTGSAHEHHTPHTVEELEESLQAHDEWFRHDASEPHHQEAHGQTNTTLILGFLGGTVVFVAVVGFIVYQYFLLLAREQQESLQERRTNTAEVRSMEAAWGETLSSYGWVDAQAGVVRVPLEVARERVIERYRGGGD